MNSSAETVMVPQCGFFYLGSAGFRWRKVPEGRPAGLRADNAYYRGELIAYRRGGFDALYPNLHGPLPAHPEGMKWSMLRARLATTRLTLPSGTPSFRAISGPPGCLSRTDRAARPAGLAEPPGRARRGPLHRGGFHFTAKPRTDRGQPRRLAPEVSERLVALKTENRSCSVQAIIRTARDEGIESPLAPSTVHRLLAREKLFDRKPPDGAARRRFAYRTGAWIETYSSSSCACHCRLCAQPLDNFALLARPLEGLRADRRSGVVAGVFIDVAENFAKCRVEAALVFQRTGAAILGARQITPRVVGKDILSDDGMSSRPKRSEAGSPALASRHSTSSRDRSGRTAITSRLTASSGVSCRTSKSSTH